MGKVIAEETDFPPGVINIVTSGDHALGAQLSTDPRVDLVAEVGRRSHRIAWITPEPERYWAQSGCAMADYAEHCSGVVSVRDGAEMLARCDELGAALR